MKGYFGMFLAGIAVGLMIGVYYVYSTNSTCKPPTQVVTPK